ncbi:MAG: DivIVA domain-containing protein [Chitinispirillaceae bacterium]|nr:DivIVA domain-containing protein [Chitinispirillaceae bacterium]
MRITPLDIRKQPFRRAMRGFDRDAVNSFLEMVANEFEGLIQQNGTFATKVKQLEEKCESYAKIERTLNETLLTAQKLSDDARIGSQKEADLIIREATARAGQEENEIRRRIMQLENDLASLKNQRDTFLERFKGLLTTQLNLLGTISGDLGLEPGEEGGRDGRKDEGRDTTMIAKSSDKGGGEDTVAAEPAFAQPAVSPPRFSLSETESDGGNRPS